MVTDNEPEFSQITNLQIENGCGET